VIKRFRGDVSSVREGDGGWATWVQVGKLGGNGVDRSGSSLLFD